MGYATKNTLPKTIRDASIELLNRNLAAAIDLHAQAKQAHWNVQGPAFIAVRELFDKVAGEIEDYSDTIAERAVSLGGTAEGTIQAAAKKSFLKPYTLGTADISSHVEALSSALASFGESARRAIDAAAESGDADTADLFTEVSRGVDKLLWLVEAHLGPR